MSSTHLILKLSMAVSSSNNSNNSKVGHKELVDDQLELKIISYNMHGFNQGFPTVRDLWLKDSYDIFLCQEHWLTPSNLSKFEENLPNFMCFGSSAMDSIIETGVLRGRPFGGVMTLVNNKLQKCTELICATERYVIVAVGNLLVINVYLPCAGTDDRMLICDDIFNNILLWIKKYPEYVYILGGDMNTNLHNNNQFSNLINNFARDNNFYRCDELANNKYFCRPTYFNESLNCSSTIDFFLTNDKSVVSYFEVIDHDSNLSDHLPITISCACNVSRLCDEQDVGLPADKTEVTHLRWDHADIKLYNTLTGFYLQSLYSDLDDLVNSQSDGCVEPCAVDAMYNRVVDILHYCASLSVPTRRKNFFKFWWDQELDELKQQTIASCGLWKAAGRPRYGPIFSQYRKDKNAYRRGIRGRQRDETSSYTNELHEALSAKQGTTFWKCWKAKFESNKGKVHHVDGTTDAATIAGHFAEYFSTVCSNSTIEGADRLKLNYEALRSEYCGMPDTGQYQFDAELVENVIMNMSRGKAAGLDGLTAEHLQLCHALLPAILAKLFNMMMSCGHVPAIFGQSYTVPIPKGSNTYCKSLTVDDFRGISISCVLSKILEHCILARYELFFKTHDNQFGFKKAHGCSHAIYTLRCAIDHYTSRGTTVNICAIDLSKAFDKMNHHGLFTKLMQRGIPSNLLRILETWFKMGCTCVKWCSTYSVFFKLSCGIRQGGVLSPYFFAIYVDSIVDRVKSEHSLGCYVNWESVSILMYADDIIVIAPSVIALQELLLTVELELVQLDMQINARKSKCMRIGPRFNVVCAGIFSHDGRELQWSNEIRYLGVYLVSAKVFTCSYSNAKRSFYRSFNGIFGKVGRVASEEVVLELVKSKCMPAMLYGVDVCPINNTQIQSLQFAVNGMLMKVFNTKSKIIIHECMDFFRFPTVSVSVLKRKHNFLVKIIETSNSLCKLFVDVATNELNAVARQLR